MAFDVSFGRTIRDVFTLHPEAEQLIASVSLQRSPAGTWSVE